MVDAFYEDGTFYVSTNALSSKIRQIESNSEVAIAATDWFFGHGIGQNLGWVMDAKNAEIRLKLCAAFSAWYDLRIMSKTRTVAF